MLVRLLRAVLYICAGRAAAVLCYPTAAKQRCDSDSCSALGATAGKPRTHPSYWPSLSPLQQRHTQTMETHTHRGLYSCSCWIQYVCTHTHACTHTHTQTQQCSSSTYTLLYFHLLVPFSQWVTAYQAGCSDSLQLSASSSVSQINLIHSRFIIIFIPFRHPCHCISHPRTLV